MFIGAQLFGGPVEFVLAGSGHIAGVVNPPPERQEAKYQYWTNPKSAADARGLDEGAKETPGSWWPHWPEWLAKHSGDMSSRARPAPRSASSRTRRGRT